VARFIDPFYSNTFLDANILNELAGEHGDAVKEILRVYDEEQITLLLPYSVQAELEEPEAPVVVRDVARTYIYSVEVQLTQGERAIYARLLQEVTGNAQPKNIERDLFHVFEAHKNGAAGATYAHRSDARTSGGTAQSGHREEGQAHR